MLRGLLRAVWRLVDIRTFLFLFAVAAVTYAATACFGPIHFVMTP